MKIYSVLLISLFYSSLIFGQDSLRKWQPCVGISFTNIPVMQRQGDTVFENALSLAPFVRLVHKSGIGIGYSPKFVTNNKIKSYLHELSLSYEQYDKINFDISAQISHFFFTKNPGIPFTPLTSEVFTSLAYKRTWLKPLLLVNLGFGRDSLGASAVYDMALAGGISHDFEWTDRGIFSSIELSSSLLLNASTSQYFSFMTATNYISHNHDFQKYESSGKGKGSGSGSGSGSGGSGSGSGSGGGSGSGNQNPGILTAPLNNKPTLSLSNVELNLDFNLEIGSFHIKPAGSIFLPIHNPNSSLDSYWQIAFEYHF